MNARTLRNAWLFGSGHADKAAEWSALFSGVNPREFMTAAHCVRFDGLPNEFTVYRGFQNGYRDGLAWTTSREAAEMFANLDERFPRGEVIERRVRKSEVFAAFATHECEVIIL